MGSIGGYPKGGNYAYKASKSALNVGGYGDVLMDYGLHMHTSSDCVKQVCCLLTQIGIQS